MTNYEKSNAVAHVDFMPSKRAERIARKILASFLYSEREKLAYFLINELSYNAGIERLYVEVTDTRQWHRRARGRMAVRKYGSYHPGMKHISIQNRTAVFAKEVAPKTFLDTLLHEWMHHYDYKKLHLNSIHTKGFYERIRSLEKELSL